MVMLVSFMPFGAFSVIYHRSFRKEVGYYLWKKIIITLAFDGFYCLFAISLKKNFSVGVMVKNTPTQSSYFIGWMTN